MGQNVANTPLSYANALLHPISKNTEPTKCNHEAPYGMVLSDIFLKMPNNSVNSISNPYRRKRQRTYTDNWDL